MIDTSPPLSPDPAREGDTLAALEAALDWWREAGVDYAFGDEAHGWLEAEEPAADATAAPPPAAAIPAPPPRRTALERALAAAPEDVAIAGDAANWPQDLAAFREWWMTEPTLAGGALDRRLPPRGVADAKLMILLPQPLAGDRSELAEGGAGKFLGAITSALGFSAHETYLASVLPAAMALPDWAALARQGIGAVTSHHIALTRPQRVLLFGRSAAGTLGVAASDARAAFTLTLADGNAIPVLAVPELAELARTPARRERFWNAWLDWTK